MILKFLQNLKEECEAQGKYQFGLSSGKWLNNDEEEEELEIISTFLDGDEMQVDIFWEDKEYWLALFDNFEDYLSNTSREETEAMVTEINEKFFHWRLV